MGLVTLLFSFLTIGTYSLLRCSDPGWVKQGSWSGEESFKMLSGRKAKEICFTCKVAIKRRR